MITKEWHRSNHRPKNDDHKDPFDDGFVAQTRSTSNIVQGNAQDIR
jgi:hypothetical protein